MSYRDQDQRLATQVYKVTTYYPYEGEMIHFMTLYADKAIRFLDAYADSDNMTIKEKHGNDVGPRINEDDFSIFGTVYTDGYNDTYIEIIKLDTQYGVGGWIEEFPIEY